MNSIMTSDDATEESEFLSALNASPESFVHKALKVEQIECIHRIVCHGRKCFGHATDGIRQERFISINFKRAVQPMPHQKPQQNSLFFVGLQSGMVPSPSSASETGGRVLQNKPYFCRPYCTALHENSRCSCLV